MTITPKDAASKNDDALRDFVTKVERKIDDRLTHEHYTGGPPVDIEAIEHPTRKGVDRMIMARYNTMGWEISVKRVGDKTVWQFVPAKR